MVLTHTHSQDNIRALLSTLHTILWENSGWTPPGMTDLVEPSKVKRSYMKANLVVHPDKVKQKGGTVEQIVIADMAFDTLKTAWSRFETNELQRRWSLGTESGWTTETYRLEIVHQSIGLSQCKSKEQLLPTLELLDIRQANLTISVSMDWCSGHFCMASLF